MDVNLTKREAAAVLDLLRVVPSYIGLDEQQRTLVEQIKRKLRPLLQQHGYHVIRTHGGELWTWACPEQLRGLSVISWTNKVEDALVFDTEAEAKAEAAKRRADADQRNGYDITVSPV